MSRQEIKVTYFSDIVGRFDQENGKIYGVSVITEGKAKGHDLIVDSQTLMEVKEAAEAFQDGRLKTKLNHRSGVESVFGYLENFRVSGPKLLADLKMFKSHKDFAQTFEQIESLPNAIGLSVAFVGKESHSPTGEKLARCREILSADLVPEPAANPTGMFDTQNGAVVDTEILGMNEPANAGGEGAGAAGAAAEPTLTDVMNFLQEQVLPRIEKTEQFQAAIQAELDAAAGDGEVDADGNPIEAGLKAGDDGNRHHEAGKVAGGADGGTRAGAVTSPSNTNREMVGAGRDDKGELVAAGPAELKAITEAVINLERRINAKEDAERETQLENALLIIKTKTEKVTEYARSLEEQNVVLLEALRTGVRPAKNSASDILFDTGKPEDFQSRVAKHVGAGKSKTEAVMLARKEDPQAHITWLAQQGVVTTL